MKVLAVRQPWASLIIGGIKDIEVRTFPTNIREYIAIYATRTKVKQCDMDWLRQYMDYGDYQKFNTEIIKGKILGTALLVDCKKYGGRIDFSKDMIFHWNNPEWYNSKMYGWDLANAEEIKTIDFKFKGSIVWSSIDDTIVNEASIV
jgi:hypothetical protein